MMKIVRYSFLFLLFFLLLIPSVGLGQEKQSTLYNDPLLKAMQAELKRAQKGLKIPEQPDPYFISYWVEEVSEMSVSGKYGAVTGSYSTISPRRIAGVQIRVGDYSFDNTNLPPQVRFNLEGQVNFWEDWAISQLPIEGNESSLRSAFWLLSDISYKKAIENYQKKKVLKATTVDNEKLEDFYREKPNVFYGPIQDIKFNKEEWEDIIRKVTEKLAAKKWIFEPTMEYRVFRGVYYYVNTEGTVLRFSDVFHTVSIVAWSRTKDGMKVNSYRHFFVHDPNELPNKNKFLQEADVLAKELYELSEAEEFKPYTGPAILLPDVAGVFFHEALGHRLEGNLQRMLDAGHTFKGKIGEKILPEFLTIIDDPTMEKFKGKSLVGHYKYDDEGVAGQKVVLVEKGILKNYLLSRTPVKGFSKSNGHGRIQATMWSMHDSVVGRMANLKVESENKLSWEKLKAALIKEAKKQGKPYGLIIKKVVGGETNTQGKNFQAFKATPILVYAVDVKTGKEKLVRGVEIVGTPLVSLENVVATGNDEDVYNATCNAESGWIPVSVISPSILTTQIELQRVGENPKKPPILPSPFQSE